MSTAVSWVITLAINDGQKEAFTDLMNDMVESTRAESGTLTYEWFISEDGTTVEIYERYTDSGAVMVHLGNFGQHFAERILGMSSIEGLRVFGEPNDDVRGALTPLGAKFMGTLGGFAR